MLLAQMRMFQGPLGGMGQAVTIQNSCKETVRPLCFAFPFIGITSSLCAIAMPKSMEPSKRDS